MNAVLIDDEQNNIDNLSIFLASHCPQVHIVGSANDADQGRLAILQYSPDLVFLDIQMPGKNGFEMLKSLTDYSFEVIFVTAYDQYGIQAVKFSAIDYLLKPINANELKLAVQRAEQESRLKKQNLQLENLIQILQQQHQTNEHRIALPTLKETRFVNPQQIIYCESTNNYTNFYLDKEEKLIVSRPIYEYEELLTPYGFIRCHQSFLVNKKYIKSWLKEEGDMLLLSNGMQVPVSRNKKDRVKEAIMRRR